MARRTIDHSHEPSAISHDQHHLRLLEWSEVAPPRTDAEVAAVLTRHLDVDLAPRAVGLLVGGEIAEGVLRADLRDNFVVDDVELLDRRREERLAAGHLG